MNVIPLIILNTTLLMIDQADGMEQQNYEREWMKSKQINKQILTHRYAE